MKTISLLLSLITISIASAQNAETINIPEGIVYNYGGANLNERATKLINDNLSNNNYYTILTNNFVVGPELWKRFQKIKKLQKMKGDVSLRVNRVQHSAKLSQNLDDSKLIWDEFRKEITGPYKIRKANEKELKYFWSVISFNIDEPLLVVETENHNYILNLLQSNLKLLWLDEAPRSE